MGSGPLLPSVRLCSDAYVPRRKKQAYPWPMGETSGTAHRQSCEMYSGANDSGCCLPFSVTPESWPRSLGDIIRQLHGMEPGRPSALAIVPRRMVRWRPLLPHGADSVRRHATLTWKKGLPPSSDTLLPHYEFNPA